MRGNKLKEYLAFLHIRIYVYSYPDRTPGRRCTGQKPGTAPAFLPAPKPLHLNHTCYNVPCVDEDGRGKGLKRAGEGASPAGYRQPPDHLGAWAQRRRAFHGPGSRRYRASRGRSGANLGGTAEYSVPSRGGFFCTDRAQPLSLRPTSHGTRTRFSTSSGKMEDVCIKRCPRT